MIPSKRVHRSIAIGGKDTVFQCMLRLLGVGVLICFTHANAQCSVLAETRRDRGAGCWASLHAAIAVHANESHVQVMRKTTQWPDGHTIFFAGSSHMRTMVLDLLEFITGRRPDSSRMASRQYACPNLDGMDIERCGWPASARWLMRRDEIIEHKLFAEPPEDFPQLYDDDEAWRIVYQFKTFVSTPRLDRQIVRQLAGYTASCLVIEVGAWGFLEQEEGSLEDQAWRLMHTLREGFKGSIILVIDGYHSGAVGPHIKVEGAHIAPTLKRIAGHWGDIFVFDRTESLHDAATRPLLSSSMAAHGYAGAVATRHVLSIMRFLFY